MTYVLTRTMMHESRISATGLAFQWRVHDDEEPATTLGVYDGQYRDGPAVHHWATTVLYRQAVRAVAWVHCADHTDADPHLTAVLAPARGHWEVTEYRDRHGVRWLRVGDGGGWRNPDGMTVDDDDALIAGHGPLSPWAVTGLAALLAEVAMFRVRSCYLEGPEECRDAACDEYEAAAEAGTPLEVCSHLRWVIASGEDACALIRVEQALETLEADSAPPGAGFPETAEQLAVREATADAAETIRAAIDDDDG